jgi:hypothetical protein
LCINFLQINLVYVWISKLKDGPNFSYKIIAKLPAGIYYGILELPDGFRKYFKVQKI